MQDQDTSLKSPHVHCERCSLKYGYWQVEPCQRCEKNCCVSCMRVADDGTRLDVVWYCLECYEAVTAQGAQA